jgi:acetyltransferase-like isoleucine patch superfamily enzyme
LDSEIGNNITIENHVLIMCSKLHGYNYINKKSVLYNCDIGKFSYIAQNAVLYNMSMGMFCSVGSDLHIVAATHPTSFISTSPYFYQHSPFPGVVSPFCKENINHSQVKKVTIGNDVWIGERVTLMGGITIGDGAIIGANALVTKDVPSYSIVGGVPAKILKYRFSEDVILNLLNIQWWNKDEKWFKEHIDLYHKDITSVDNLQF